MIKVKTKKMLPYMGIPLVCIALYFIRAQKGDILFLFLDGLLLVLGYIAAMYDLKINKVPNQMILVMLGVWIIVMLPKLLLDTEQTILLIKEGFLGFVTGGGLFLLVYLISRKGLGGGDVKFMAVVGLYIGFAGSLSAMLCGTLLAALYGFILILVKKIKGQDTIPLVPFLYMGILLTVFFR